MFRVSKLLRNSINKIKIKLNKNNCELEVNLWSQKKCVDFSFHTWRSYRYIGISLKKKNNKKTETKQQKPLHIWKHLKMHGSFMFHNSKYQQAFFHWRILFDSKPVRNETHRIYSYAIKYIYLMPIPVVLCDAVTNHGAPLPKHDIIYNQCKLVFITRSTIFITNESRVKSTWTTDVDFIRKVAVVEWTCLRISSTQIDTSSNEIVRE